MKYIAGFLLASFGTIIVWLSALLWHLNLERADAIALKFFEFSNDLLE